MEPAEDERNNAADGVETKNKFQKARIVVILEEYKCACFPKVNDSNKIRFAKETDFKKLVR